MKSTKNNNTESNTSTTNAEEINKLNSSFEQGHINPRNTQLTEQIEIENTPFTAVRVDKQWFLSMGKYRISEIKETFEECKEDAYRADWIRIMTIMKIVIEEHEQEKKQNLKK